MTDATISKAKEAKKGSAALNSLSSQQEEPVPTLDEVVELVLETFPGSEVLTEAERDELRIRPALAQGTEFADEEITA